MFRGCGTGTGPLSHSAFQGSVFYGRPGGGAGRRRQQSSVSRFTIAKGGRAQDNAVWKTKRPPRPAGAR